MNKRIVGVQDRIDSLQAKAKIEPVCLDTELQSQIARFLCVLSSGLMEQALIMILTEYAQKRCHADVSRYVSASLSRIRNAKFEDVLIVLRHFSPDWREHFEKKTAPEIKDAIDSIVNNRNQIAHGAQTGISLVTFMEYYKRLKAFIVELDAFVSAK
jgi:hypothetical protein